jgi:hypothetical protein
MANFQWLLHTIVSLLGPLFSSLLGQSGRQRLELNVIFLFGW